MSSYLIFMFKKIIVTFVNSNLTKENINLLVIMKTFFIYFDEFVANYENIFLFILTK